VPEKEPTTAKVTHSTTSDFSPPRKVLLAGYYPNFSPELQWSKQTIFDFSSNP
jgi:hypothetical protein